MQAIISKYLQATNTRGARIKTKCERGSITTTLDHGLSDEAQHVRAAQALVEKFVEEDTRKYGSERKSNPWFAPRVCGCPPSGEYVHVFVPREIVAALNGTEDVLERKAEGEAMPQLETEFGVVQNLVADALKILR